LERGIRRLKVFYFEIKFFSNEILYFSQQILVWYKMYVYDINKVLITTVTDTMIYDKESL
jgi:hypothetical protein